MRALTLSRFDPAPYRFPRPAIPLLAQRSPGDSFWAKGESTDGDAEHFRSFALGRYALAEAYRLCGLTRGTTLLAPAYHCLTMLDPAVASGADILLYPLDATLGVCLDRLDDLVRNASSPVKVLLATHFFGRVQDFSALRTWCDAHGVLLVEDCAHVLLTPYSRRLVPDAGRWGHYVTASPYKFLACMDGGLLYADDPARLPDRRAAPLDLLREARGLRRLLSRRRVLPSTVELAQSLKAFEAMRSDPIAPPVALEMPYLSPSIYFDPAMQAHRALRISQRLIRGTPLVPLRAVRRANYARWLDAVSTLPHCTPLYPDLPDDCIPYMFPLLIDHPLPHFFWLKRLGMPIWRWDESARSDCPVAQRYRLGLLHLPCHQAIDESHMDWMTGVLRAVLQTPPGGPHR